MADTASKKGSAIETESFSFKAETKQLLNILIHSLYKDRDVFLRELISNASDALNRIRFEMLTKNDVLDPKAELCIRIYADKDAGILTIQDSGIGMTKSEIIENLGTIAQSGARNFIEAVKDKNQDLTQMIGQFGVGFYSVFMVAESVRITSRSYKPRAKAVSWQATGENDFQVGPAEMNERGTKIEIKLKEDAVEFADEFRLKNIIHRHSDYIGFPIFFGDDENQVNKQTSLWRTAKSEINEEQYREFYRQVTLDFENPLLYLHSITDAPVQLYALLFVPAKGEQSILSLRKDDGLKLYSRNILIDEFNKDLLPDYLRFVQGVVDSEDLPLNVSRETVQSIGIMPRLKKIITGLILKELENLAKNDSKKYEIFWQEFGVFIKQGIASNQEETENLQPLLRFRSSLHPESWSSLEAYAERMQAGQKKIYYIIGDDSQSIMQSPHLDYFKDKNIEVLLLSDPMDSFMMMAFRKYKDYDLENIAQTIVESDKKEHEVEEDDIPKSDFKTVIETFKKVLGERVLNVRPSNRLSQSVARLADPEDSINPEIHRVYKYLGKEYEIPKKILELNLDHPILKSLMGLKSENQLQTLIIEQIYESALLVEGLHPDPSSIAPRVQEIIEAALKNNARDEKNKQ